MHKAIIVRGLLPSGIVREVEGREMAREKIENFEYWTLFCDFKLTVEGKSLSTR